MFEVREEYCRPVLQVLYHYTATEGNQSSHQLTEFTRHLTETTALKFRHAGLAGR